MKIKLLDYNKLDYSSWVTGTTGSIGNFTENATGTVNSRVLYQDPFGYSAVTWKGMTTVDANNQAGGWKTISVPVDVTKTYRSSCWVKRTDSFANQNMYSGILAFSGSTQINTIDISTGTISAFNYNIVLSDASVSGMTTNEWRLHLNYIYPSSWTGTTDSGGVYKPNGVNLGSFNGKGDLKFSATTTHIQNWELFPYSTGTGGSGKTSYAFYPRIDLVDGTEPSLATLLSSEGPFREVSNVKIKNDNNYLNYSTWSPTGTTGTIGMFNIVDATTINQRITDLDPFGNSTNIWKAMTTLSGSNYIGGYTTNFQAVDITKTYRTTCWIKRTDNVTNQSYYYSVRTFNAGGTQVPVIDISAGTNAINSYMTLCTAATTGGYTQNEWRLHVGYIYPSSWTGTTDNVKTGIIKPDGTNLGLGSGKGDFKFSASTTQMYQIVLAPYSISATVSGLTAYYTYPRIDLVDGTEPSIATLLAGEGPWRDVVGGSVNISGTWKTITGTTF